MRLDELVVEDFKKLKGRHVVRPAALGITVVSGDNEEGKSTLLDALKAAFFMKHNTTGADRDAIQPFAGGETPAVTVGFTLDGSAYRLAKRFRRGGVQLETPEGLLEGDAAELRLASLLQFEWPGRGAARDTHTGVAGLFWVDQGTTFAQEQGPSPTALRGLQPALADQVAALGRGERAPRLMTEVRRRRDQHWTGKRDQPRGELATLEREVAELRVELSGLEAAEAEVEALLDRLAATLEKRRAWLAADHLGRARLAVDGSRSTLAGVRALEEEKRVRSAERQAAASELRRLQDMADLRRQRLAAIDERAAEQAKLARATAENAPLLDRARRQRAATDAAAEASRRALAAGERERETVRRRAERLRLARELAALERLAADVRATAAEAAEQQARADAEAIDEIALEQLETMEVGLKETRAALRAVATRLVLRPDRADAEVLLGLVPVDPAAPIELTAPATLILPGFGRIEVTPGGKGLAELRRALADGEAAFAGRLAALGAASLAEARRRLLARNRHAREAEAARQKLATLLRASGMKGQAALDAACVTARARLAGFDDVDGGDDADDAALEAEREAVERTLAELRERDAALSEERRRATEEEARLGREADVLAGAEARAGLELAKLEDQLAIERDELADAALAEALTAARAVDDRAAEAVLRVERELARAAPEAARLEAEQAARRLAQLEEEGRDLEREVVRLEAELKGAGGRGIGDRKGDVQGRLELAERRHARLFAEARAWRLLAETLEAVDRARQDALVEPLEARLAPYMRQLMGEAVAAFAPESLRLETLRRSAASEPFSSLSVGTREQLAILVRLAIGDLLVETRGQSPPLILDDALVYADAVRLARMKTILQQAAARQQILVLTCRKEDYLGLDARYLRLEDCRA
jgi:hypothetical protein